MNRAQRKREMRVLRYGSPSWPVEVTRVIRSLLFFAIEARVFAFPGSLRTGTGRIAYGVWGRPKECEGIAKRNQSKKKKSDKEGSELRQSRGSRIRDGRIKGGGGGGSRGTLEQASYRGSR